MNRLKQSGGSFGYLLFISFVAALGGLLFGYDAVVVSGTNSQVVELYNFTQAELGFYVSCVLWGCAIGSVLAGPISDRWGRKWVLIFASIMIFISAFWSGFAAGPIQLILARLIGGFGIGAATVVCPLYISEVSPEEYRGRMVTLFQLTITIGIVMCVFANWGIFNFAEANMSGEDVSPFIKHFAVDQNWRLMFLAEALPGVLFLLCALFIPESPRYLIKVGRADEALKVLNRINGAERASRVRDEIVQVLSANDNLKFRDLFTNRLRRPLIISLLICILSEACGCSVVFYYGPMIFESAGFKLSGSLGGFAVIAIVNFIATLFAIAFIDRAGRRKLLTVGIIGAMLSMIAIGVMMHLGVMGLPIIIAINMFIAFFASALGPVKFVITSEIFPNGVRGQAIALSTFFVWITSALVAQFFPIVEAATPAGVIYFIFAAELVVFLCVVRFMLPETKNRSIEEIERSWLK